MSSLACSLSCSIVCIEWLLVQLWFNKTVEKMLLVFCSMKNGWTAIMPMEERGKSLLHNPYLNLFVLQALLKMVGSYSTVALSPSRRDALTESPLRIVLFALRKMCDHTLCRNFLRSSELLPVIVHLRQSPDPTISEYASAIASRACQA